MLKGIAAGVAWLFRWPQPVAALDVQQATKQLTTAAPPTTYHAYGEQVWLPSEAATPELIAHVEEYIRRGCQEACRVRRLQVGLIRVERCRDPIHDGVILAGSVLTSGPDFKAIRHNRRLKAARRRMERTTDASRRRGAGWNGHE